MKLLVIFSEPYFLLTEEEGIDEKECIEQALNKFNKEHLISLFIIILITLQK